MARKILARLKQLGRWARNNRPYTILAVVVFASIAVTYNSNRHRAEDAHRLGQETHALAGKIVQVGQARRLESCRAFAKLYRGKRDDVLYQFNQINTPLTREFFHVTPRQIAEVRKSYVPRYIRWANVELPTYCPQQRRPTPPFPRRPISPKK